MNILITGGTGFLGQRLGIELLHRGELLMGDSGPQSIDSIHLTDSVEPGFWHEGLRDHPKIKLSTGDISDEFFVRKLCNEDVGVVFHLASVVSGQGEQDFDLAMRVNLDGTRYLFDALRANCSPNTRVLFTSSVAAFGGELMPDTVGDLSKLTPLTTYGMTKVIGEQLINEYTRKGFFDGRSARLPTVIVRPGKPNQAASSFVSGLFREPLNGEDCIVPVDTKTPMPVLGYRAIINGMIRLVEIEGNELGQDRAVGLPALNMTVQNLIDSLHRVAGERAIGKITVEPNDFITNICKTWPRAIDNSRSIKLGLPIEASADEIIEYYIRDYLSN